MIKTLSTKSDKYNSGFFVIILACFAEAELNSFSKAENYATFSFYRFCGKEKPSGGCRTRRSVVSLRRLLFSAGWTSKQAFVNGFHWFWTQTAKLHWALHPCLSVSLWIILRKWRVGVIFIGLPDTERLGVTEESRQDTFNYCLGHFEQSFLHISQKKSQFHTGATTYEQLPKQKKTNPLKRTNYLHLSKKIFTNCVRTDLEPRLVVWSC